MTCTFVVAAKEMKGDEIVIKAQVHAGGRGKGHFIENGYKGGVQFTTKYIRFLLSRL